MNSGLTISTLSSSSPSNAFTGAICPRAAQLAQPEARQRLSLLDQFDEVALLRVGELVAVVVLRAGHGEKSAGGEMTNDGKWLEDESGCAINGMEALPGQRALPLFLRTLVSGSEIAAVLFVRLWLDWLEPLDDCLG